MPTAKWLKRNRERAKTNNRRGNFRRRGIQLSTAEYDEMVTAQRGLCAICLHQNIAGRQLAVDHDHVTGEVRGLLCSNCNMALGLFKDDPDLLISAVEYLRQSSQPSHTKM